MRKFEAYPLTITGPAAAVLCASFFGVWTDNLYVAYAAFVLVTSVSLLWRSDDPPVLPFIAAYQWLSITAGYWHEQVFGTFPGYYRPGDVERTMFLGLSGLLVLSACARVASQIIIARSHRNRAGAVEAEGQHLQTIGPLFVVVMLSYGVEYVYSVNAREFGSLSSFIQRVLEFRQVLLVTLWLEILRSRKNHALLLISFVWAVLPRLGSYYSDFKSPVVLMLIVLAASWRPWQAAWWPRSVTSAVKAAPFVVGLVVLLLVWQGGLKRNTRLAHDEGAIGEDPAERITFFIQSFRSELPRLLDDPQPYIEGLVERVSYITFFSRVLEHVPAREPHADGELLRMAVTNAFVPRFIMPDKPELPSDSYYTRRFAGIQVAETGTSVSIGYMAEFYADWGLLGMFLSIAAYGLWIGLVAGVVRVLTPVPLMRFAALTVVLLAVADFEQQFIKGFAALNLNMLVTLVLLLVLRPWLVRTIGVRTASVPADAASAAVGASVR